MRACVRFRVCKRALYSADEPIPLARIAPTRARARALRGEACGSREDAIRVSMCRLTDADASDSSRSVGFTTLVRAFVIRAPVPASLKPRNKF